MTVITIDIFGERGLYANWPWTPDWQVYVGMMRRTLGFEWRKEIKCWVAEGAEAILDLDRYGVPYRLTPEAEIRVRSFRQQLDAIVALKSMPLPPDLYGYQEIGTRLLILQERGVLADDRGMGKTKQAIDAARQIGARSILILAGGTELYNWPEEIEKWAPDWEWQIVPDAKPDRIAFWERERADVLLANYEKVLRPDWPIDQKFDAVIFDEASRAKTATTKTHQRARMIAARSRYAFAITGTPMEMRVEELNSVLGLVRPAVLGSQRRFADTHLALDFAGRVRGIKDIAALRERIAPWIIRRDKSILGLPPKLRSVEWVEFSPFERSLYDRLKRDYHTWVREQQRAGKEDNPMTQLLRFQQLTDSPQLIDPDLAGIRGAKYASLTEILRCHAGKAVVFTRFSEMASRLAEWLDTNYLITGKTVAKEARVPLIHAFNDDPDARVLVSTDAGAYGVNITGADVIVNFDLLWNPGKMEQRADRLHRIGQEHAVTVIDMVVKDTIDEGILRVLGHRDRLIKDIVDEAAMLHTIGRSSLARMIEGRL